MGTIKPSRSVEHLANSSARDRILMGPVMLLEYITSGTDTMKAGAKKVPKFYVGNLLQREHSRSAFFGCSVAVAFGGIHCIGWSSPFQTRIEQLLWRWSAVALVFFPVFFWALTHESYRRLVHRNAKAAWDQTLGWAICAYCVRFSCCCVRACSTCVVGRGIHLPTITSTRGISCGSMGQFYSPYIVLN